MQKQLTMPYKNLTIAQIKTIVNSCEEYTVKQIGKTLGIDPTIVYYFLLHIGINEPFGGNDFVPYQKKYVAKKVEKKDEIVEDKIETPFVRAAGEYSNSSIDKIIEASEQKIDKYGKR